LEISEEFHESQNGHHEGAKDFLQDYQPMKEEYAE